MSQLLQLWAWWVSLVWELSRAPTVSVLLTIWLCCWAFSSCYMDWLGFPGGSDDKESACNEGDLGSVCGLGRSPRGGHGNPLQHSCLENPPGQRSLAGYSPQGRKELDMTEWLSTTRGSQRVGHDWVTKHNTWMDYMKVTQFLPCNGMGGCMIPRGSASVIVCCLPHYPQARSCKSLCLCRAHIDTCKRNGLFSPSLCSYTCRTCRLFNIL